MEIKLPEGWASSPLKDVVSSRKGKKPATVIDHEKKGYDPYLLIDELEGKPARAYTNDMKVPRSTKKDVLLVWDGSIGKCATGISGAVGSTIVVLSPNKGLNTRFLEYFIRRSKNYILETSTGTGLQHINKNFLKALEIPLPPDEKEQELISDKLDSLLAKVKDAQARLDKLPLIIKRLRQSMIEQVFSDVGEENLIALGMALPKGHIFDGPFGSNLKTSDYTSSGIRVVRLENIGQLNFIEEKESYISTEKYKTLMKHTVYEGDIIFASFIADEIRVCVLPKLRTKAIAKADCFCIRTDKNINPEYLAFQLTSSRVYDYLAGEIHGVTRPRINTTQLKKLMVYIPPIEEQTRIVQKIKLSLNTLDHVMEYFNKVKTYTDKLEQSILAKAFRGELVT